MGSYNPDIAIQQIASDPRVAQAGRVIRQGRFVVSGPGGSTYTAGGVGTAIYLPVDFGAGGFADSWSINVTTLGATSQYRLALYRPDPVTALPGGLQADLGALDVTATGVKASTAAAQKVQGIMFLLLSPQGSNVAVLSGAATGVAPAVQLTPYLTQATAVAGLFTNNNVGYTETASVTAAPPANANVSGLNSAGIPIVVWRFSALPQF